MSDFTNALVNMISPDQQIMPIVTPTDNVSAINMVFAESLGMQLVADAATGDTLTATPTVFADATASPFSLADLGRYIVIRSGANAGTYRIKTFTSTSSVTCVTTADVDAAFTTQTTIPYGIYDSPSLESSLDYMITQTNKIIGRTNWFDAMPKGFDAANTDVSNTKNETIDLSILANNWLGSKTEILDLFMNNSGSWYGVAAAETGKLVLTSTAYATPADRRGLVIQASSAHAGTYHDEITLASIVVPKHKVAIIDKNTMNEFEDSLGNPIYGVLQDGADHSGVGSGTDVFVRFVHDVVGVPTAYAWTATDAANVAFYLPVRKKSSEILEYDRRRTMLGDIVGDAEVSTDLYNLWGALGLVHGEHAGDWDLTNTGNYYAFSGLSLATATMEDIVNILNSGIGDRDYSQQNVIANGESISDSLDKLDVFVGQATIKSKIYERVSADILKGVSHLIPFSTGSAPSIITYKMDTAYFGRHMDVYVGGVKLVPDSTAIATDGQYQETDNTHVTFRFKVTRGQIIEYAIRDNV